MEKIKIGLEWFLNPDHLPIIIGMEKGWFEDAGLIIELIEPREHYDAVTQLNNGNIDIAITEPLHLVEDRAAGEDVIGFARFLHTNGGVMYVKNKGIDRPRDLIGKRIQHHGASDPCGLSIVQTMAANDGAPCTADDFILVNNGFFHSEALANDEADAATLIFKNIEITQAENLGLDVDYFALKDWGIPDFCQLVFITSSKVLIEREESLQKFVSILRKSIDYIFDEKEDTQAIYMKFIETSVDKPLVKKMIEATIPFFTFDFSMSDDYFAQLQSWLVDMEKIEQPVDPRVFWTNRLSLLAKWPFKNQY